MDDDAAAVTIDPALFTVVIQLSEDRTRVVNHAQRDSAQAHHRSMTGDHPSDDHDPVGAVIARHGARVASASPYEVVAAFAPQG